MASKRENMIRAQNVITSVKQAVVDKGVNIPDGTLAEEYASFIGSINGDGGDTEVAYNDGYAAGVEQGRADELREFWVKYQQNGERKNYSSMCNGEWWTNEVYDPQHPFVMDSNLSNPAYQMYANSSITDTKQPIIMGSNVTKTAYVFYGAKQLRAIRNLTVDEAVVFSSTWFRDCALLEELNMSGTIGQNGFDVHWSTQLNHDSHISIFNALSTTATITIILSLIAVNKAFETSSGAADGSMSEEWLKLIGTKSNVTISLA